MGRLGSPLLLRGLLRWCLFGRLLDWRLSRLLGWSLHRLLSRALCSLLGSLGLLGRGLFGSLLCWGLLSGLLGWRLLGLLGSLWLFGRRLLGRLLLNHLGLLSNPVRSGSLASSSGQEAKDFL